MSLHEPEKVIQLPLERKSRARLARLAQQPVRAVEHRRVKGRGRVMLVALVLVGTLVSLLMRAMDSLEDGADPLLVEDPFVEDPSPGRSTAADPADLAAPAWLSTSGGGQGKGSR